MKRILLIIIYIFTLSLSSFAQRTVINLNDNWSFSAGWNNTASVDNPQLSVSIPHTWNLDALTGNPNYQRQMGNYLRQFDLPKEWQNEKELYLRFKGVNQTAEIYVNGKRVGKHKGGYTAFGFNITSLVKYDSRNILWVRVSNVTDLDVMPLTGDFNIYGGVYRDVELIATPKTHFSHTEYATKGIKIRPYKVTQNSAKIRVETKVDGIIGQFVNLTLKVKDAEGNTLKDSNQRLKIGASGSSVIDWWTEIESPILWNGTINPYLYRLEAIVSADLDSDNKTSKSKNSVEVQKDSIAIDFGVRYYEVDKNNQFLLNGESYPIKGVTRHQDKALVGNALHPVDHIQDLKLMQEMGVNAVRLTNYPQDEFFIELCDRAGIIVWSELPFLGPGRYRDSGFNESLDFQENGIEQLEEMISQQYNHPSVMFWGLYNELSQRGNDPAQYVKELNGIAKEMDPYRLTTAASNQDGELNFITDLIGFNQNIGWDGVGVPSDLDTWSTAVRRDFPELKVALSQYGAGSNIYQHQDSLVKPEVNSSFHPQEWQCYYHEEYLRVIGSKKAFWGTFAEAMFDYGDASYKFGESNGVNNKGFITFDRANKKDVFYLYKANWNKDDKFVYITGNNHYRRSSLEQDVKVYSNCQEVSLRVNGEDMGAEKGDELGVFIFKGCKLKSGRNVIEALSTDGYYDVVEFIVNPRL